MIVSQLRALVSRDVKLLSRSKSSSAAILLGPLLVILIVGVVFSGAGEADPALGVVAGGFSDAELYQQSLADSFVLSMYTDSSACVRDVQGGFLAGCVVFGSSERTAQVHVDPTDVSVVYMIIDRVTGVLDEQSGELRSGLTSTLLSAVSESSSSLGSDVARLEEVVASLEARVGSSEALAEGLGSVRVDAQVVSVSALEDAVGEVFSSRDAFMSLADTAINNLDNYNRNRSQELRDAYRNISAPEEEVLFADIFSDVAAADEQLAASQAVVRELASDASALRAGLSDDEQALVEVRERVRASQQRLLGLGISEEDITSPLETEVVAVTAEDDSFGSLLPQFLVLLVMFTALLLASQLVVGERASSAYFRNFTTPTRDWVFVLATYVSTVLVLLVQLVLLFLVVGLFSAVSILSNFLANFLVLFLVASFFAFLGMLIGYVFKTQEGVMLSAITVSSLLMLVSGLVLPVQTLPSFVQFLVSANPFVISSDLLTGTLVFGFGVGELLRFFVVLGLYAVMLFAAIMLVQRAARVKYFESSKTTSRISTFLGESEIPEGKELRVGERVVASKQELLAVLVELSDEEYERFADHQRNLFADWVRDVYKDDRLSRMLRNTSRSGAIAVLEKELR